MSLQTGPGHEAAAGGDISVNDAFRPLTRYFDRISRPEQILRALPQLGRSEVAVQADPVVAIGVQRALQPQAQREGVDARQRHVGAQPINKQRTQCEPDALLELVSLCKCREVEVCDDSRGSPACKPRSTSPSSGTLRELGGAAIVTTVVLCST